MFMGFTYYLNKEVKTLRKQNMKYVVLVDSLRIEQLSCNINLGRYEVAQNLFFEEYRECGEKYDSIVSKLE